MNWVLATHVIWLDSMNKERLAVAPKIALPIPNETYTLSAEVNRIVPCSAVEELSLERLKPWDRRPFPLVQDTGRVDKEVAAFLENGMVLLIENGYDPFSFVPDGADYFVIAGDVLPQAILPDEVREVGKDLARRSIAF